MYESTTAFAQNNSLSGSYGVAGPMNPQTLNLGKASFIKSSAKTRLNAVSILVGILLPCALFTLIFVLESLEVRSTNATVVNIVVTVSAVLLFLACASAVTIFRNTRIEREPSWVFFILAAMVIAWILAFILGDLNYKAYTKPYLDLEHMRLYKDINPEKMRGHQLMDAGRIDFTNSSVVDRLMAMAFKNGDTYCVAPITEGNRIDTPPMVDQNGSVANLTFGVNYSAPAHKYDFWAVGVNCCNEKTHTGVPSFDCSQGRLHSLSGTRFMGDRAYFRLAVQQAEATYNIKATHPLFFEMKPNSEIYFTSLRQSAALYTVLGVLAHFVIQTVAVLTAVLVKSAMRSLI